MRRGICLVITALFPAYSLAQDADAPVGPIFWGEISYLRWNVSPAQIPPLISASSPGTPINRAGVLDGANTRVLFGGGDGVDDWRSGVRGRLGIWLDPEARFGLEISGLWIDGQTNSAGYGSFGDTIISRPFVNALTGRPAAERVSFPGDLAGVVTASEERDPICGFEALARVGICRGCDYRVDALAGYRYLRMSDAVRVTEDLVVQPGNPAGVPAYTTFNIDAHFDSQNVFNGAEVGLLGEFDLGPVTFAGRATVAMGVTRRSVNAAGLTQTTVPGQGTVTLPGGLLALSTNSGSRAASAFTIIPEVGGQVFLRLTSSIGVGVGYSVIYWPNIARSGEAIDTLVNPTRVPGAIAPSGPPRPAPLLPRSDVWLQGVDVTLRVSF